MGTRTCRHGVRKLENWIHVTASCKHVRGATILKCCEQSVGSGLCTDPWAGGFVPLAGGAVQADAGLGAAAGCQALGHLGICMSRHHVSALRVA